MAKKEKVDTFVALKEKTDRMSIVYANDPFWKAMKAGCDALEAGEVSEEVKEFVQKERDCWGPTMSNKGLLSMLLERMNA